MENFTQIPNEILDDERLSLQEKGMLAILHRNSSEWKNYTSELASRSTNGINATTSIMKSLEEKGYITSHKQLTNAKGRYIKGGKYYTLNRPFHGKPQTDNHITVDTPFHENPLTDNRKPETVERKTGTNNTNGNNSNSIRLKENNINKAAASKQPIGTDFRETDKAHQKTDLGERINTCVQQAEEYMKGEPVSKANDKLSSVEAGKSSTQETEARKNEIMESMTYRTPFTSKPYTVEMCAEWIKLNLSVSRHLTPEGLAAQADYLLQKIKNANHAERYIASFKHEYEARLEEEQAEWEKQCYKERERRRPSQEVAVRQQAVSKPSTVHVKSIEYSKLPSGLTREDLRAMGGDFDFYEWIQSGEKAEDYLPF